MLGASRAHAGESDLPPPPTPRSTTTTTARADDITASAETLLTAAERTGVNEVVVALKRRSPGGALNVKIEVLGGSDGRSTWTANASVTDSQTFVHVPIIASNAVVSVTTTHDERTILREPVTEAPYRMGVVLSTLDVERSVAYPTATFSRVRSASSLPRFPATYDAVSAVVLSNADLVRMLPEDVSPLMNWVEQGATLFVLCTSEQGEHCAGLQVGSRDVLRETARGAGTIVALSRLASDEIASRAMLGHRSGSGMYRDRSEFLHYTETSWRVVGMTAMLFAAGTLFGPLLYALRRRGGRRPLRFRHFGAGALATFGLVWLVGCLTRPSRTLETITTTTQLAGAERGRVSIVRVFHRPPPNLHIRPLIPDGLVRNNGDDVRARVRVFGGEDMVLNESGRVRDYAFVEEEGTTKVDAIALRCSEYVCTLTDTSRAGLEDVRLSTGSASAYVVAARVTDSLTFDTRTLESRSIYQESELYHYRLYGTSERQRGTVTLIARRPGGGGAESLVRVLCAETCVGMMRGSE